MMSLLFSGCSNTWGGELEDPLRQRYSRLVADHYDITEVNIAECGKSNDAIVCKTNKHLEKNEVDIVVIQFTVAGRFSWIDDKGKVQHWTPSDKNRKSHDNHARDQWYKWIYNPFMGAENAWKNIFLWDSYCKSRGQKYIPLIAAHWSDDYHEINGYWKQYYFKGKLRDSPITCIHREILRGGYPLMPHGHPSPEAHKRIAEVVIEHVDSY